MAKSKMRQISDADNPNKGNSAASPAAKARGQKNDAGTPASPYNHGDNGIFYLPYSNNQVVSTIIMPRGGLLDRLPVLTQDPYDDLNSGSLFGGRNYVFDTVMTGLTEGAIEDFANQPTTECAEGPEGGLLKLCTFVNTMGHYKGKMKNVSLFRAGQVIDRLDEMAVRLLNSSPALQDFFGTPEAMPEQDAIIMNETARRLFEVLASFRRFFSRQIWSGNPANNSGEARQILGLDIHINTGTHVDAFSGAACAAADPIVENFNYNAVNSSTVDIVQWLEKMDYDNMVNAERMGLNPFTGFLVMREALFFELTGVMPVKQYEEVLAALAAQGNAGDTRIMIDATAAQADRDRFRNQFVLPLNGRMVPVVLDDGIEEENSTTKAGLAQGEFASDIYYVCETVLGGLPATFFQYFNHDNQQAQGILQQIAPNAFTFASDGGAFRWHLNYLNGCVGMNFEFAPWLKSKFPMLNWRLTNVKYAPVRRNRSPYADDPYFVNGGNVATSNQAHVQQLYTPWSPSTPAPTNI